MIRILVFGMTENPGGVESFLISHYRRIDRSKIQFDFLCNSHDPIAYEDEILALGGRTFHITARSQNCFKYIQELEDVFRQHASEWQAIWENVSSLANIDYLKIAKQYGIKKRIIHSHNSQNMDSKLRGLLHFWNKRRIKNYATDFWACSEEAAHWFYNDKLIDKCSIIHNAIDVNRMRFDAAKRNEIRARHGWEQKLILGNIGRLHFQKNQEFALDIFREYHGGNPDSVLVLVGQGEDETKLREKARELAIQDSVFFAGVQEDIQGWLSCFDLFLFPSQFEGLGIAALEAQANGVPVLASKDVIPAEVKINKNFQFFDLEAGTESWAKLIESLASSEREDFETIKQNFIRNGYDIENECHRLENLLLVNTAD